jgi:hypothetical protein
MVAVFHAGPAHADIDTDFANQLHAYGIYGPRDENAWLAKLICKQLTTRVDETAFATATFLKTNLDRTTSTGRCGSSSAQPSTPTAPSRHRRCNRSQCHCENEHGARMKNASTPAVRPAVTRSFAIGLIAAATVALGPFGRAAADATDNFPIPTG